MCLHSLPTSIWSYRDSNLGIMDLFQELYETFHRRQVTKLMLLLMLTLLCFVVVFCCCKGCFGCVVIGVI
jgi:hypothetical protein